MGKLIEILVDQKKKWDEGLDDRLEATYKAQELYNWIEKLLTGVAARNYVSIKIDKGEAAVRFEWTGPVMTLDFRQSAVTFRLHSRNPSRIEVAMFGKYAGFTLRYENDYWIEDESSSRLTEEILEKLLIDVLFDKEEVQ